MPLTIHTRNPDGTYGPTENGHYYISKTDHRRTANSRRGKSKWLIKEGEEFSVFKPAIEDYNSWYCPINNCIFGLVDEGMVTLGINGEKLAKFPNDRNPNEPWHGYPVSTEEAQNRPSTQLLDLLKDILPMHLIVKLEKGNL